MFHVTAFARWDWFNETWLYLISPHIANNYYTRWWAYDLKYRQITLSSSDGQRSTHCESQLCWCKCDSSLERLDTAHLDKKIFNFLNLKVSSMWTMAYLCSWIQWDRSTNTLFAPMLVQICPHTLILTPFRLFLRTVFCTHQRNVISVTGYNAPLNAIQADVKFFVSFLTPTFCNVEMKQAHFSSIVFELLPYNLACPFSINWQKHAHSLRISLPLSWDARRDKSQSQGVSFASPKFPLALRRKNGAERALWTVFF